MKRKLLKVGCFCLAVLMLVNHHAYAGITIVSVIKDTLVLAKDIILYPFRAIHDFVGLFY